MNKQSIRVGVGSKSGAGKRGFSGLLVVLCAKGIMIACVLFGIVQVWVNLPMLLENLCK